MDWIGQMKTLDVFRKLMRGDVRHMAGYPFVSRKPDPRQRTEIGFSVSAPEKTGVSSLRVRQYFQALDACPDAHPHSVWILRSGKLIARGNWFPYSDRIPHMMFSLSKSVVSLAFGIACQEGLVTPEDRLVSYFPQKPALFRSPRMEKVTLWHLLTMTSTATFSEAGSVAEKDWVRAFLAGDCSGEPGSRFVYNSMNTYMLSAVLQKVTGMPLTEYLTPRLFEPMEIPVPFWETCPMGVEKGGWGLYLTVSDMAKLGQLLLQKGMWETSEGKKQLVPSQWVEEACSTQVLTGDEGITAGYGYQFWSFGKEGFQMNGVFGQRVIVLPDKDLVIAVTAGSRESFTDPIARITQEFFGEKAEPLSFRPLKPIPGAQRALRKTLDSLRAFHRYEGEESRRLSLWEKTGKDFREFSKELDGRRYRLEPGEGGPVPLVLACLTNNFLFSPKTVSFRFVSGEGSGEKREPGEKTGEEVQILFAGQGEEKFWIRAGLDGETRVFSQTINGDPFLLGAMARMARDEEDRPVLKIRLCFLETPCVREIKCVFYQHGGERKNSRVLLRFGETPDALTVESMVLAVMERQGENGRNLSEKDPFFQKVHVRVEPLFRPKRKGTELRSLAGTVERRKNSNIM